MTTRKVLVMAGAGLVAGAMAQSADATIYQWSFVAGQPGGNYALNNGGGGNIQSFSSTFDTVTKQLDFTVNFSNQVTQGFWLAMNGGPNPKGHAGEMAIYYFDGSRLFDANPGNNNIFLTAYTYNGVNGPDSAFDGSPNPGVQAPDLIKGANEGASWINGVTLTDNGGGRSLSFSVNAASIISHSPAFPDSLDPWHGTGFADKIGVWFHSVSNVTSTYDNMRGGFLTGSFSGESYMDGQNFTTSIIPAPGSLGALGLTGAVLLRRRRR